MSTKYFCPETFWNYDYCNTQELTEKSFAGIKIKGKAIEDLTFLFSTLLNSAVHPSLLKTKFDNDEEDPNKENNNINNNNHEKAKTNPKNIENLNNNKKQTITKEENLNEQNDEKNEEITEKQIKEVRFNSVRIDQNTLKILFFILPKLPIISFKASHNNMTLKNFELLTKLILNKPNNIYSFNFEWNEFLINEENNNQKMIFNEMNFDELKESETRFVDSLISLVKQPEGKEIYKLEALSFRGCYLGDKLVNKLLYFLKDNQFLLVLNLYKNLISNECLENLSEMFLHNRKLQEINLGGNFLDDYSIKKLKENIGIYELNDVQYNEMLEKINEREQIIAANKAIKKNSKVQPKPVPFVDEIKDEVVSDEVTKHYKVKNNTIQKIDFINSPNMTQNSFDDLMYLIDNTTNLILNLDLRKYNKESVLKMINIKGNYCNRVFLYK